MMFDWFMAFWLDVSFVGDGVVLNDGVVYSSVVHWAGTDVGEHTYPARGQPSSSVVTLLTMRPVKLPGP